MARIALHGIDVALDGTPQPSSTTIGAVGAYAVVVATALPDLGVTLTSSYLAAIGGDVAASHLCSVPGGPPIVDQHVLPADQLAQTHVQACVLDHVAELQSDLDAFTARHVTIAIADTTLEHADRAWRAHNEPPQ